MGLFGPWSFFSDSRLANVEIFATGRIDWFLVKELIKLNYHNMGI